MDHKPGISQNPYLQATNQFSHSPPADTGETQLTKQVTVIGQAALKKTEESSAPRSLRSYIWRKITGAYHAVTRWIARFFSFEKKEERPPQPSPQIKARIQVPSQDTSYDAVESQDDQFFDPTGEDVILEQEKEEEYFDPTGEDVEISPDSDWESIPPDAFAPEAPERYNMDAVWTDYANSPPEGMPNLGNTCYCNASNQALFAFAPLVKAIFEPTEQEPVLTDLSRLTQDEINDLRLKQFCRAQVLPALQDVFTSSGDDRRLAEERLMEALIMTGVFPDIDGASRYGQHDAAGYIQALQKFVLNNTFTLSDEKSVSFDGKTISVVKTSKEGMLRVEMGDSPMQLQQLIDEGFKTHQAGDERNAWRPDEGRGRSFSKYNVTYRLTGEPCNVLPIQLKRFGMQGIYSYRDGRHVEIPKDNCIDLSGAYGLKPDQVKYQLKSFVCHHGSSTSGGHYISFVNRGGIWYRCDDSRVRKAFPYEVDDAKRTAYVLLFERVKGNNGTEHGS